MLKLRHKLFAFSRNIIKTKILSLFSQHYWLTLIIDFAYLYENKPNYQCHSLICIFYHRSKTKKFCKHRKFQFYVTYFEFLLSIVLVSQPPTTIQEYILTLIKQNHYFFFKFIFHVTNNFFTDRIKKWPLESNKLLSS